MYVVLARLPSAILETQASFIDLVTSRILNPLGMHHTTYSSSSAKDDGLADGFTRRFGSLQLDMELKEKEAWKIWTRGEILSPPFWNARDNQLLAGSDGVIMSVRDVVCRVKY